MSHQPRGNCETKAGKPGGRREQDGERWWAGSQTARRGFGFLQRPRSQSYPIRKHQLFHPIASPGDNRGVQNQGVHCTHRGKYCRTENAFSSHRRNTHTAGGARPAGRPCCRCRSDVPPPGPSWFATQTGTWERATAWSYKHHLGTRKNGETRACWKQDFIKPASPRSSSLQTHGNSEAWLPTAVKSNQTARDYCSAVYQYKWTHRNMGRRKTTLWTSRIWEVTAAVIFSWKETYWILQVVLSIREKTEEHCWF